MQFVDLLDQVPKPMHECNSKYSFLFFPFFFSFFVSLLIVQSLHNIKVVEVQLLPLPKRIHATIAHLQGKLPLQGAKEKHVYV